VQAGRKKQGRSNPMRWLWEMATSNITLNIDILKHIFVLPIGTITRKTNQVANYLLHSASILQKEMLH
jgi:hypothetical protein